MSNLYAQQDRDEEERFIQQEIAEDEKHVHDYLEADEWSRTCLCGAVEPK